MTNGTLLVIIGGLILTIGDLVLKGWATSNNPKSFIIGMAIWIAGLVCLAFSFKHKNIAIASLVFTLTNIISLCVISWLVYKESLTNQQMLGIFLGVVSVALLER